MQAEDSKPKISDNTRSILGGIADSKVSTGGQQFYSGQNVRIFFQYDVNNDNQRILMDNQQYISINTSQSLIPIYNVFSFRPQMFLQSQQLVQGAIGFNISFIGILAEIAQQMPETPIVQKVPNQFIYYVRNIIVSFVGDQFSEYESGIILNDVYMTNENVQIIPDGNPIQDIYQFVAQDIIKVDKISPYYKLMLDIASQTI